MRTSAPRPTAALYRITRCDQAWHVLRPQSSLAHGFADLDRAFEFVKSDCDSGEATVELLVDNLYMLKPLGPGR